MMKKEKKENLAKININWYPGHMAKTKRQIIEDLRLIDLVVEILDARTPISSRNPDIDKITAGKTRLLILNKSDLAEEKETEKWVAFFKEQNLNAVIVDSNSGKGINRVTETIEKMMEEQRKQYAEKGRVGKAIRIMVLGIPNVGKSSFINRMAKRTKAEVGNKPGVTKAKQWIRVNSAIELLDTPGVLWPKFENEKVALNLAFTGTIKDDIMEIVDIAYFLLKYLLDNYKETIIKRYGIEKERMEQILSQDRPENENIYEIMLWIGKKRGAVISGGNIDEGKTARIVLDDFRSGKLGKITIEKVEK